MTLTHEMEKGNAMEIALPGIPIFGQYPGGSTEKSQISAEGSPIIS